MALHCPQHPYPDIKYIGIAIQGTKEQRHIGILFRTNRQDPPKLLHLAFHQRLICESPEYYSSEYHWLLCPGFSEDEQLQLAVRCEKIYSRNGRHIPYGLSYSLRGYFKQNGDFNPPEKDCGLTCATFIMAIFDDFGYPIIDIGSWPCREEDAIWHRNIIDAMKNDQERHPELYSREHIGAQEKHIGIAARFRPEEVAGSAHAYIDDPLTFEEIEPLGRSLLEKLLGDQKQTEIES